MENQKIFEELERAAKDPTLSEQERIAIIKTLERLRNTKINILIAGATGSGKSSTINAMFKMDTAKVGVGVDPETMDIQKFELGNMTLWDTPGLGDDPKKDKIYAQKISDKILELDENNEPLIDLVLVIIDGSNRDYGTAYELITTTIIPALDDNSRLLVAINQADLAMKGNNWDKEKNEPNDELIKFLEEKVKSTHRRIKEATGVDVVPIYYSAGFKNGDKEQQPYNLSKLLYFILKHTKSEKRVLYGDHINPDPKPWTKHDGNKEYIEEVKKEVRKSLLENVQEYSEKGADLGEKIGDMIGMGKVGRAIGAVGGAIVGGIKSLFD